MTYQMEVGMLESLVEQMLADALEAERLRVEARAKLVGAVRRGAAAGMSQREIARAVNRSQPEVARLLRFFPASERGSMLAKRRREVIDLLLSAASATCACSVPWPVATTDPSPISTCS